MRTLYVLLLCLSGLVLKAQNMQFQDFNFKVAVLEAGVDLNGDLEISMAEAEARDTLRVPNRNINSIEGIEHFKNLVEFDCNGNRYLRKIQMVGLRKLEKLKFYNCDVDELVLEDLPELFSMVCSSSGLDDTLDLSNLPNLKYFYANGNNLEHVKFVENSPLVQYFCNRNWIREIDVQRFKKLTHLSCESNSISELEVSGNVKLKYLNRIT